MILPFLTSGATDGLSTRTIFSRAPTEAISTIVNWPQNDYLSGNLIGVTPAEFGKHMEGCQTAEPVTPILASD